MHQFVPIIRYVSPPTPKPLHRGGNLRKLAQAFQPRPDANYRTRVPLERVLPGPPLRRTSKYQPRPAIAFENVSPKPGGGVCSVDEIWVARRNGTRQADYSKMRCFVQVVTTPTADTPGTTLLLHFDAKRYLIGNIAEGTQRAAVQRKLGLAKVSDILLTGKVGWGTTGGILGMILTVADVVTGANEDANNGKKNADDSPKQWLNIHGGTNLTHLLATARRFVFRKGLPIHTQEFRVEEEQRTNWDPTWKDDLVQVWAMVLESDEQIASPRKRSHDEFSNDATEAPAASKESIKEQEDQDDQIRKGVVASMFSSKWRLDTLVTKKLSKVVMPAAIFFRNEQGKIEKYTGPLPGEEDNVPDIDVLVRNPWPGALIENLPATKPATTAVSYIIKGYPQRGKFLPQIAKNLGVKPREFGILTRGESVTTADGTVVTPEQVMEKGKPGTGFAVIELPERAYIEALVNRKEWSSKEVMEGVGAIVWILGPGVVEDPKLQKFMADHSEFKHIVSSTDVTSNYLALESSAEAAIRLHLLDRERFPIPVHSNVVPGNEDNHNSLFEPARIGMTVQLEPKFEVVDENIVHYLDTMKTIKGASSAVQKLADKAKKEVTDEGYLAQLAERQKDIPSKDAEIVTLGTGSALPSKYRNVSATLVRVPGYGSYLFDCGENTLGQLKRVYGDELPQVLRELKAIWISHLHADHHLGTASVIKAWHNETREDASTKNSKLVVASDKAMLDWLREFSEVETYGYDRLHPIIMGLSNRKWHYELNPDERQSYGLKSIDACTVEHCAGALAVVFTFPHGFKVAYSGDCRPSREFARIGKNATLLIHEATFDDELRGDALAKKHSTTSEALDIGRQMNARRILLTHFSQRYQKIPVMDRKEGVDQVAIVAFDYMKVKLGDFAKLERFKEALMKLYEDKE